jgi:hypothetical protein
MMTNTYKVAVKISDEIVNLRDDILVRIITKYYNNENKCFSTETDRIIIPKQLVKEAIEYFMKHEPDRFKQLQYESSERVDRENGGE